MPRILPPPTTKKTSTTTWKESWQSGSILLYFGYFGVAVLAIDRYLQYQQYKEAQSMIQSLKLETRQAKRKLYEQYKNTTPLYTAKIIHAYKNMGGTYGLSDTKLNDTVEILQENVGLHNDYHLCRTITVTNNDHEQNVQIGWYPKAYLQRIDPAADETTNNMRSIWWWKRLFVGSGGGGSISSKEEQEQKQ